MDANLPAGYEKCVVIAAPHTSNWDFVYSMAFFSKLQLPIKFLAKKELFKWPLKALLQSLGGMPVHREKNSNLVEQMIGMFNATDALMLIIPAEGTRGKVTKWKTGFYHVALGAKVPLLLGFLDYEKKIAGFGPLLYLTGNTNTDAENIKNFYRNMKGKHPQNFDVEGLVLT